jgi:hypothetical protein
LSKCYFEAILAAMASAFVGSGAGTRHDLSDWDND